MAQAAAWLGIPPDHQLGLAALPYGSYTAAQHADEYRIGVAIGDSVLDLTTACDRLMPARAHLFRSGSLDDFLAAGDGAWAQVRAEVTRWLSDEECRTAVEDLLISAASAELRLPFTVADYVDFYASAYHASNVGRILRPESEPLAPNWRHLPVGYHGRAGTVVVTGSPVRRPCGQFLPPGWDSPSYGPSGRLDFEAELGFVVGNPSHLGEPVTADRFAEHVFGVCLVNDWSARDIQAWESRPLGPFAGKSFATSVSGWVLPLAALEHARIRPPSRDALQLGYLTESVDWGLDINFEVRLNGHLLSRPVYAAMYWSPAQMMAHLTGNGASLRSGDLYASGTVSGSEASQLGCLLELTENGAKPVTLPDGSSRSWLLDGDEVAITASAPGPGGKRIRLGAVTGSVLPAVP
ncbi:MAG TPA: fumarylacetoacetase [Streptosporangiaceae bacterium]